MGKTMNTDAVHGSAELIDQRGTEQIGVSDSPGLVRVIQAALGAREDVVRREVHRRRSEVVNPKVASKERVLGAGLVIGAPDILPLIHPRKQAEGRIAARGGGLR